MRKLIGLALCGVALPALAADLRPPVQYAVAPALYQPTWLGLYAGGNLGYGGGILGGVQAGYNWQWGTWVVGIEADAQARKQNGNSAISGSGPHERCCQDDFNFVDSTTATTAWRDNGFATIRGRLGTTLWRPDVLFYLTAGVAVADFDYTADVLNTRQMFSGPPDRRIQKPAGPTIFLGQTEQFGTANPWGWTIGGGIEKKIGLNWSVKAEYLYVDLGVRPFLIGGVGSSDFRLHESVGRIGVNYAFQ